jgi:hypothetical protein
MWNDIPADELKQLMDEIDATELRPDEAELERCSKISFRKKRRREREKPPALFFFARGDSQRPEKLQNLFLLLRREVLKTH